MADKQLTKIKFGSQSQDIYYINDAQARTLIENFTALLENKADEIHTHTASQITNLDIPQISNMKITICQDGIQKGQFTLNQMADMTIQLDGVNACQTYVFQSPLFQSNGTVSVNLSQYALTGHTHTASQVTGLGAVAISNDYNDLINKPNYAGVFEISASVQDYDDLPINGNRKGDVRHVISDGSEYFWDGSSWEMIGTSVDLSNYSTIGHTHAISSITDLNNELNNKQDKITSSNKLDYSLISNVPAVLTAGSNLTISNNTISLNDSISLNGNLSGADFIAGNHKLSEKANTSNIPTKTSDLTNDSGFLSSHQDISGKQDKITSFNKLDYSLLSGTPPGGGTSNLTAGSNLTISNNTINLNDSISLNGNLSGADFIAGNHKLSEKASVTYVENRIANVISGAPAALDTLKELSDALSGDANFAVTITNSLSNKQDKITSSNKLDYSLISNAPSQTQVDSTIIQNSANPVAGGAVYDALGNIESLLASI